MKNLRATVLLLLFTCLFVQSAAAFEFKDITFVGGTLYNERKAKFISLQEKEDAPLRLYVSSGGLVEFIDKKSNTTIKLFDKIDKPLLVYRIDAKKPSAQFYAVFDRSVRHDMKTDNFVLLGSTDKKNYIVFTSLPELKEQGWAADGLQLRLEDKQLVIEGINKDKRSPDNEVHPFVLNYDQATGQVSFLNLKAQRDAEDLPKILTDASEFVLAGFQPGDKITAVSEKYGENFFIKKMAAEETEKAATEETSAEIPVVEPEEELFLSHVYNKDLEFLYEKKTGDVYGIFTSSSNYASKRGLKVGMSFNEMVELYGRNYKRTRGTPGVINYIYNMKKQHPDSTDHSEIGFSVNSKGKIIMIFVDQLSKVQQ